MIHGRENGLGCGGRVGGFHMYFEGTANGFVEREAGMRESSSRDSGPSAGAQASGKQPFSQDCLRPKPTEEVPTESPKETAVQTCALS